MIYERTQLFLLSKHIHVRKHSGQGQCPSFRLRSLYHLSTLDVFHMINYFRFFTGFCTARVQRRHYDSGFQVPGDWVPLIGSWSLGPSPVFRNPSCWYSVWPWSSVQVYSVCSVPEYIQVPDVFYGMHSADKLCKHCRWQQQIA